MLSEERPLRQQTELLEVVKKRGGCEKCKKKKVVEKSHPGNKEKEEKASCNMPQIKTPRSKNKSEEKRIHANCRVPVQNDLCKGKSVREHAAAGCPIGHRAFSKGRREEPVISIVIHTTSSSWAVLHLR